MLERILIPLDGSELAESVLVQIRQIVRYKDAEILLLGVVTLPPSSEADASTPLDVLWSRATDYIRRIKIRLLDEGIRVQSRVVEGFPAPEILKAVEKEGATLVAMSTHGRTGLARWAMGSVTEKILRTSPVPVLAVPSFSGMGGDAFPTGARELPFRTLVAPIAPAELSLEIVPPLAEFARLFGSRVLLLNVCEGAECEIPVPEMREAYDALQRLGVTGEPVVRKGDVASQILDFSLEAKADLIALTTHGRSGMKRWMLGSVAEKVLRSANIPLLVVHPGKEFLPVAASSDLKMTLQHHSDP